MAERNKGFIVDSSWFIAKKGKLLLNEDNHK